MFENLVTYLNDTLRALTRSAAASPSTQTGEDLVTNRAPAGNSVRRAPGLMDIGRAQPDYRIFAQ